LNGPVDQRRPCAPRTGLLFPVLVRALISAVSPNQTGLDLMTLSGERLCGPGGMVKSGAGPPHVRQRGFTLGAPLVFVLAVASLLSPSLPSQPSQIPTLPDCISTREKPWGHRGPVIGRNRGCPRQGWGCEQSMGGGMLHLRGGEASFGFAQDLATQVSWVDGSRRGRYDKGVMLIHTRVACGHALRSLFTCNC
jgi:hypothetical protein